MPRQISIHLDAGALASFNSLARNRLLYHSIQSPTRFSQYAELRKKMTFRVEEVKNEQDFTEMTRVLWVGFNEPYNATTKWFYPQLATEDATLAAIQLRLLAGWKGQPAVHWLKAIEVDSSKIVGVAQWNVNDPGEPGPHPQIDPPWFVEGTDERRFAGKFLTSLRGLMKDNLPRAHLELSQISMLPEYRNHGAARLLMEWGIQKSDKLGLESVVASVPFAVPFYEKVGYGKVASIKPDVSISSPSEQWSAFASEDIHMIMMWRPAGHPFRTEEDQLP